MHVNAYFNVIICNAYTVNVGWAPSLWSCMLLCPILKDPTRLPLSRHSEVLLLSRWRHQLPFPYPVLTAGLIQVFRSVRPSSRWLTSVQPPRVFFLKTYSNSVFLSPFVPMASSSGGEQLRGLALNPCLQLPPSLLAFSYWIRINWNFHKGWYKSLSQVNRCGLTRVELC